MTTTLEQRMDERAERDRKAGHGLFSLTLDLDKPNHGPGPRIAFVCVNCGRRFNELRPDGSISQRHIRFDPFKRYYVPTKTGAKAGLVADSIGVYHRCAEEEGR